ncbi:LysR substrate-binding domain-containing protein [Sphingobium yanoikuyae]|jgi:LysR family glycine cleavage system transcriptional activator|uniref:LysR family transcriptional regulator n=1 Tax=Sphingobium yanoikuyae TaxID=13690 RepID=A0A3G2UPT2_SPHYA|nr:LysR substrate-binding domain-containing protein [Sphingobium yanoikuyae]AYO77023.1 LysR family transcriptional regulator [Sphingobium yanoikuyae]
MKPSRSVPTLAMLRAFDAFGRAGGIRKAALMLEVDHAVVSRHLSALEAFVGTALIDRSAGVRGLTSDGAEYHRRITAAFQEISNATLMLRKRHDQQLLIWCSPGFAYHWLSPRLSAFAEQNEDIAFELRPMDYSPDFAINEADGDIRYVRDAAATALPAACRWFELAKPLIYPVASPALAEAIATRLRGPRDLLSMRLLHEESDMEWRLWFASQDIELPPSAIAGPRLWHAHVMLDAAKSGQGIALANDFLAKNDLSSGQLVALQTSEHMFKPARLGSYQFVARADRWHNGPLARLRNWLVREAS